MGALQATLKGTVVKMVKRKCENRAPMITSSDTNLKGIIERKKIFI